VEPVRKMQRPSLSAARFERWQLLLLLFLCDPVSADDVVLSWTLPTGTEQYSDAGPYTNPGGTKIWQLVEDITDPEQDTITLAGYTPGVYKFVATAYDTEGVSSRVSGQAEKTVTSFKALAGAVVYQPVSITNGWWLLPVGTVSEDVECIVAERTRDKYAVPVSSVSWSPGVVPKPLVVADCS
jgi:hypothetical protein